MTTTELPDQSDLPVQRRRSADPDWSFLSSPKWILSHLFALTMIVIFIIAMFWQLDRHNERAELNERVTARSQAAPLTVSAALLSASPEELDYRLIEDRGEWLTPDLVRVANRTQDGVAGEWVVGTFQTVDGTIVLINRGFVALGGAVDAPPQDPTIRGWLRQTQLRQGLGVADTGTTSLAPRLDIAAIGARIPDSELAPMWVQIESPTGPNSPNPVPLPDQTSGPHLSYAGQWAIFAVLGAMVYLLLLRRIATTVR